jgi:hypothetical protein
MKGKQTMNGNTTKELVMKRAIKRGLLSMAVLAIAAALIPGCDNVMEKQPFQAGLGRMVDVDPPAFNLTSHSPGAFLRGLETFSGTASDDVSVKNIMVSVKGGPWVDVAYDSEAERWEYPLDTAGLDDQGGRAYPDGPFSLQFKVWDDSGREPLVTGKYAFTVKNGPPSLELQIPYVNGTLLGTGAWSSVETGFNDPDLNKEKSDAYQVKPGKNLTGIPSNGSLIGTIEDLSGIAEGYPQIKFWPAFNDDPTMTARDDPDGPSNSGEADALSRDGEIYWAYDETDPNPAVGGDILFGGWHRVEANEVDRKINNFTFTFPLRKWKDVSGVVTMTGDPLPVGSYRFLIKVKDNLPDSQEIIYPIHVPGDGAYPNRYMELRLEVPAAKPEIKPYDLNRQAVETDPAHPAYDTNNAAAKPASYQAPHLYIDGSAITYKNGKIYSGNSPDDSFFILRVTASHGDGIRYATLKVRKEGSSTVLPEISFEGAVFGQAPGANIPQSDPPARFFVYKAPRSFFDTYGDGTYYYEVTAVSKSGVDALETYAVAVDTVPPVTRINSILSAEQDSYNERVFTLNDFIMIRGLAYDSDSGIRSPRTDSVRYFILKNDTAGAFQSLLDGDYGYVGGDLSDPSNPYRIFGNSLSESPFKTLVTGIDTSDSTMFPGGDGDYTIFILSQDAAFNRTVDKYAVKVDQTNDNPKVEVVGMDKDATEAGLNAGNHESNIINNAAKFTIQISDDDALDLASGAVVAKIRGITNPSSPTPVEKDIPAAVITSSIVPNGESRASFELTQDQIAGALYHGAGGSDYTGQLRDGYYTLTVEAKDKKGADADYAALGKTTRTGSQSIVFVKNTASPRVTFTSPAAGNYYKGAILVTGQLEDDGPVDTGYLRIRLPVPLGTGLWENAPGAVITALGGINPQTDGKYRYAFNISSVNIGSEANESLIIGLEAKDLFGRTSSNAQVAIKVDTASPVVSIMDADINHLTTTKAGGENRVNGNITLNPYIYDGESGLAADNPRWLFLPGAAAANSPPTEESARKTWLDDKWLAAAANSMSSGASSRFNAAISTRSYTSPATGDYTILVLAKDKAGNIGANTFGVYLDQDSDLPWLDLETLTPYRSVKYKPVDGSGDYNAADESTWAVESIAQNGVLVSGVVHDDDGFNAAQTVAIEYWDGTSTEPAENGSTGWKTSSLNTVVSTALSPAEYQFTFYLPPDSVEPGFLGTGEGKRKYRLKISDALPADKLGDVTQTTPWQEIAFILDRAPPQITFNPTPPPSNPQGPNFDKNSTAAFIEGTVTEKYLTADHKIHYSMYISAGKSVSGAIDLGPETTLGSGIYNWELSQKTLNDLIADTGLEGWFDTAGDPKEGLPDQNYTVKFLVTDDSNSMTSADWNFSKDSSGPVITFNIDEEKTSPAGATILKTVQPVLKGSFRDANSLTPTTPKYFYYRLDHSGPTETDPGIIINGWKEDIAVEGQGSTVNWEIDVSKAAALTANRLDDGEHTLDIKVQDALGSWSRVYQKVSFKIDTAPPVVEIPAPPAPGVYQIVGSTGIELKGTANDALFDHISFEIGKAGETTLYPNTHYTSTWYAISYKNPDLPDVPANWKSSAADAWKKDSGLRKVDWRITLSGNLLLHDTLSAPPHEFQNYRLQVIAHDEAERSARTEWQFRNDRQAPAFNLITVKAADGKIYLQETNPRIQATVTDLSGVNAISAALEKYNYAANSWTSIGVKTLADLGIAAGGETVNWSLPLGTTGTGAANLSDGQYRIKVSTADKAGNTAVDAGWQIFHIDRKNPVLAITGPAASSFVRDTITGADHYIPVAFTVTDMDGANPANQITVVRAKLVAAGASETSVAWPADGSPAVFKPASYSNTYTQTVKTAAALDGNGFIQSGEYTLHILAEDSGGRSVTASRSFTVDNEKPALNIDTPYMGSPVNTTAGAYTLIYNPLEVFGERAFIGGVSDNNSVASLHYYLGQTPPSPDSDTGWLTAGELKSLDTTTNLAVWTGVYSWQLEFPYIDNFLPGSAHVSAAAYVGSTPVDPAQTGGRTVWEMPLYFRVTDQAGNRGLYRQNLWLDPSGNVPKTFIESHSDDGPNPPTVGGAIQVAGSAADDYGVFDISFRVVNISDNQPISLTGYSDYEVDARANALTESPYQGGGWYRYRLNGGLSSISSLNPASWSFTINNGGECNPPSGSQYRDVRVEVFAWDSQQGNYQQQGNYHGVPDTQRLRFSNTAPVIDPVEITTASGTYSAAPYKADGTMKFTGAFTLEAHVWVSTATSINTITYQGMEMSAAKGLDFASNGTWNLPGGAGTVTVGNATETRAGFTGKKITVTGLDPEKLQSQDGSFGVSNANWGRDNYTGKADVYYLTLKVEDNMSPAKYYAEQRFEFRIDNFFPKAALTGVAADSGSLAGTSALISGTFTDNDGVNVKNNVTGLQKIVVWFTKSGSGVPLDYKSGSPHAYTSEPMSGRNGDGATSSTPIPNYPKITPHRDSGGNFQAETYYSGISVDFAGESTADRDLDRYVEFFDPLSGQWSVRLNTEHIGSGPITLNYAVFDEVGNARYYSKDIVIKNFAPQIGAVVVYTDVYGKEDGGGNPIYTTYGGGADMETARTTPGALINTVDNAVTGITVRKNYLSFTILVNNGNGGLNYRVAYKGPGGSLAGPVKTLTGQATGSPAHTTLLFDKADFGSMADAVNGIFEITVWDNLTGTNAEADGLSSVRTLKVSLDNTDDTKPTVLLHDLNPLLNTSRAVSEADTLAAAAQPGGIGDNRSLPGLYNLGTESAPVPSGHIEPRQKSVLGNELGAPTFTQDTVSGKVIVRGSAFDSHRVANISLTGVGTIIKAVRNAGTNLWELKPESGVNAWITEEWRSDGHHVEWSWLWDSETSHSALVVGGVTLAVAAADGASSPNSSTAIAWDGSASASNPKSPYYEYNSIPVDLAPFILDIKNGAAPVSRSTQGWYSFYRELGTSYTLTGYNLKKGANSALYIGDGHAGSPNNLTSTNDTHTLTFNLIAGTVSGKIVLKTGSGVEAVNGRLEKINPWNLEQVVQPGRENWDHSRFAHVWRANANDYFAGSNGGSDFAMAVHPNDAGLWASWVKSGLFRTYHSFYDSSSTKNTVYIMTSHDPQRETDVYVNTSIHGGNADVQGTGTSLSTGGTRQSGVTVAYNNIAAYTQDHAGADQTGGIVVYDRNAPAYTRTDVAARGYAMEDVRKSASDHVSNRFNRPRVVTNGSRIHVSYYDNIAKELKHSTVLSNGAVNSATRAKVDDNAGAWSAIDYLSDGRPIIAYYSDTNETVKLAYGSSATPGSWTNGDLLASTDDYYRGSGLYVALRVKRSGTNANDIIHVSFYNSANNTLVYATGKIGDLGSFASMAVDTGLSGGSWADLSLDPEGNPWITCRDQTGVRVAHRNLAGFTKPSVDLLGHDNTGWDSAVVPLPGAFSVVDGRLNIETISATLAGTKGWNAAVGYPSGDFFRVLYRTPKVSDGTVPIPGWWSP